MSIANLRLPRLVTNRWQHTKLWPIFIGLVLLNVSGTAVLNIWHANDQQQVLQSLSSSSLSLSSSSSSSSSLSSLSIVAPPRQTAKKDKSDRRGKENYSNGVIIQNKIEPSSPSSPSSSHSPLLRSLSTKKNITTKSTTSSIREYVEASVGYIAKKYMSIVSWNADGSLDVVSLRRQCDYRNHTEAATWPYLLPDLDLSRRLRRAGGGDGDGDGHGEDKVARSGASDARTSTSFDSPFPHGFVALLPTTDYVWYNGNADGIEGNGGVDWSAPSPIPVLAYTVPKAVFLAGADSAAAANETFPGTRRYEWVRLIPTPYELKGGARMAVGSLARFLRPFHDRRPVVMYRGLRLLNEAIRGKAFDLGRKVLEAATVKSSATEMDGGKSPMLWFNATEGDYVPKTEMVQYRYLLDIGGISGTTWIALRWKMCSGSLVFKVDDDPTPTMDWWHNRIEPWVHYLPIRPDLSDLREKYDWAEHHPSEARDIAEKGRAVCEETLSERSVDEALRRALLMLPGASAGQRKEVEDILDDSARRFDMRLPPLMFLNEYHGNQGRRYPCP